MGNHSGKILATAVQYNHVVKNRYHHQNNFSCIELYESPSSSSYVSNCTKNAAKLLDEKNLLKFKKIAEPGKKIVINKLETKKVTKYLKN